MAYNIKNSRGDTIAIVQSGQEDTAATSLTLLGANYPQYGLQQNENFVFLLENFANNSAPVNPVLGQLWYNSATNSLSFYDINATWVAVATENYVQAQKISPIFTGFPQAPTANALASNSQIATTGFVQQAIDSRGFAPLDSPALIGVPRTPTAASGTANTQIASTEFVTVLFNDVNLSPYATKVSPVLSGVPIAPTAVPGTNDARLATTAFVTNAVAAVDLSSKANVVSPNLTGVPTAPTAAVGTSNAQIATTAFATNLFNNIDLSPYATKASPTFTGIPIAPSPAADNNTQQIATAQFVQQQKISPAFTGVPQAPTAAAGTNTTQIATTEFVQTAVSGLGGGGTVDELAGSIKMWAGATPPANWALCDGTAVSRSLYPTLFARIGTTYGAGDGSTTFNLPNFTDRFGVGAGGAYARGTTGGSADAVVPQHTHSASSSSTVSDPGHIHTMRGILTSLSSTSSGTTTMASTGLESVTKTTLSNTTGVTVTTTTTVNPTGSSATNANLPPYIACFWIIKVSDDGSGGGTLQAGAGIDITTSGPFSTITNTGVRSLTAGTGITLSGSTGSITISSTGGGGGGTADIAGSIKLWGGETEPTDWAFCDGRSLDRSAYPSLFSRIGTTYGSSSSTTFRLPDFRGRFGLGSDSTRPRGTAGQLGPFLDRSGTTRRLMDFENADSYVLDTSQAFDEINTNLGMTIAPYTQIGGNGTWWTSSPSTQPKPMPAPPIANPLEPICVFGYPQLSARTETRVIQNAFPINLSASGATTVTFWINRGTEATWGQIPDGAAEDLRFQYNTSFGSQIGPGWVDLARFTATEPAGQWVQKTLTLPASLLASNKNIKFRFLQTTEYNDPNRSFVDTWAFTMPQVNADFANPVPARTTGEIDFLSTPYIIKINDNGTQRSGSGGGDTSRAGDVKWVSYGLAQYPPGWRTADGSAVSRTEFPALFARIGTTFGAGDGSTTFNLPDLRGRFSLSAIGSAATGSTRVNAQRGAVGGSTDSVVVAHRHDLTDPVSGAKFYGINDYLNGSNAPSSWQRNPPSGSGINRPVQTDPNAPYVAEGPSNSNDASFYGWTNTAGESGAGRNVPPYTTLEAIIKMDDDSVNTGGILQAGPGISITTSGTFTTISSTVSQNPVVAGPGITVQNASGGAIVSAVVRSVTGGPGISVTQTTEGNLVINNTVTGSGLGYDQTWQDVKNARALNTTYTNTTGKPIMVAVTGQAGGTVNQSGTLFISVNGLRIGNANTTESAYVQYGTMRSMLTAIVPPGATYRLEPSGQTPTIQFWSELR